MFFASNVFDVDLPRPSVFLYSPFAPKEATYIASKRRVYCVLSFSYFCALCYFTFCIVSIYTTIK